MSAITRTDALTALLLSPFIVTCLIAGALAVWHVTRVERRRRNPYMAIVERARGGRRG